MCVMKNPPTIHDVPRKSRHLTLQDSRDVVACLHKDYSLLPPSFTSKNDSPCKFCHINYLWTKQDINTHTAFAVPMYRKIENNSSARASVILQTINYISFRTFHWTVRTCKFQNKMTLSSHKTCLQIPYYNDPSLQW